MSERTLERRLGDGCTFFAEAVGNMNECPLIPDDIREHLAAHAPKTVLAVNLKHAMVGISLVESRLCRSFVGFESSPLLHVTALLSDARMTSAVTYVNAIVGERFGFTQQRIPCCVSDTALGEDIEDVGTILTPTISLDGYLYKRASAAPLYALWIGEEKLVPHLSLGAIDTLSHTALVIVETNTKQSGGSTRGEMLRYFADLGFYLSEPEQANNWGRVYFHRRGSTP